MKGQKSPVVKRMGSLKAPLVIAGVGSCARRARMGGISAMVSRHGPEIFRNF